MQFSSAHSALLLITAAQSASSLSGWSGYCQLSNLMSAPEDSYANLVENVTWKIIIFDRLKAENKSVFLCFYSRNFSIVRYFVKKILYFLNNYPPLNSFLLFSKIWSKTLDKTLEASKMKMSKKLVLPDSIYLRQRYLLNIFGVNKQNIFVAQHVVTEIYRLCWTWFCNLKLWVPTVLWIWECRTKG